MLIPDPDFYPSRISDPGSKKPQWKTGVKKSLLSYLFFGAINFTKLETIYFWNAEEKKIWANFQRIVVLFTQKIATKLSKIWGWDPRSGIRKNLSRIQGSKRHRIPDPDPQHCFFLYSYISTDTALSSIPQIPLFRRILGSNPGLSRLWLSTSERLTVRQFGIDGKKTLALTVTQLAWTVKTFWQSDFSHDIINDHVPS